MKAKKQIFIEFGGIHFNVAGHKKMSKTAFEKLYSKKFANWEEIYTELKAAK